MDTLNQIAARVPSLSPRLTAEGLEVQVGREALTLSVTEDEFEGEVTSWVHFRTRVESGELETFEVCDDEDGNVVEMVVTLLNLMPGSFPEPDPILLETLQAVAAQFPELQSEVTASDRFDARMTAKINDEAQLVIHALSSVGQLFVGNFPDDFEDPKLEVTILRDNEESSHEIDSWEDMDEDVDEDVDLGRFSLDQVDEVVACVRNSIEGLPGFRA